ncbi:MAG: hypothetical protein AUJ75_02585 [Candidatus Omnitrophica bacterium CG1_02_49_10]|nr:MAG: hypothetical protein AUJ75_02585 [Candidatus Omnitrophica bacterium CG1_02_49_10]
MKNHINKIERYLGNLGDRLMRFLRYIGGASILYADALHWMLTPPLKFKHTIQQAYRIGVSSLPIVTLISMFIGIVLALQTAYQMEQIQAQLYIASIVAVSVMREFGPVVTSLIVAGRVGASIAAELGTMKVTEQIDALETLASNPVKYLVAPRLLAIMVMLPLLTLYADIVGILGGYIVGVLKLGIGSNLYMQMTWEPLAFKDVFTGLFKSFVFGIIICIISCYEGFNTEGGAEGVGKATTQAVVLSFIMIIAADCFFTALFYFVLP